MMSLHEENQRRFGVMITEAAWNDILNIQTRLEWQELCFWGPRTPLEASSLPEDGVNWQRDGF